MTQINPIRFSMLGRLFIVFTVALAADQSIFAQGAPSGGGSRRFLHDDSSQPTDGGVRVNGVDVALAGTNEPCVAVNPFNSQNVAMASLFRSRVSTNGGSTWTAQRVAQVPAGYSLDGDSTMAFDSQGRLFWQYLGFFNATSRGEIVISQLDPTLGTFLAGPFLITTTAAAGTGDNDKGWVAADRFAGSPFQDRLYVAWTDFGTNPLRLLVSFSTNQGATWSPALQLNTAAEGFPWPCHVAVAPNGDVYVSYHSQTGFNGIGEFGGNPDGTSGKVFVCRSTNGGVSFPQKTLAFTAGNADLTYNVQSSPGIIPGTQFWLQGAGQAWVVPDVKVPGNIYLVSNDDPDNVHGSGDDSNIYISRSTSNGVSWNAPIRVDHGPGNTFAVMPTAAMDDTTGCIVVMWYDNRLGNFNGSSHYLLDVYYSISSDRGLTWSPDVQINDAHFDPDLGAPQRLPGPPPTLRIGEYIGVTMGGGNVYGDWCGNTVSSQQTMLDSVVGACTCVAVSQQPANQVACTGGAANFSVTVSGTPSFSYQWRKDVANLTNGGSISGATSTLLTINPVALLDAAANYNCLVSDACNSPISTNNVTLTVFAGGSGNGNGDAAANGLDVSGMVTFLVSGGSPSASYCAYDMNGDGVVNINDVGPFANYLVGL